MSSTAARFGLTLGGLLLSTPAVADCDIGLVEFGSAVSTVQLSLSNGYADGAAEVIDELHGNIQCLQFTPPPNLWADWLFLVALTRYARGRDDWRPPLDRALSLNPYLSRDVVGPSHDLATYEPGERKLDPTPLPYDKPYHNVFVDGLPVDSVLTEPNGFHLIQVNNGAWWDSMIIEGGARKHDLWVPKRQPKTVRLWLSLVGGLGTTGHRWTEPTSGAESLQDGLGYFGALRGQVSVGRFTVRGQLTPDETVEAPIFGVAGVDFEWFGAGIGAAADRLEIDWTFRPDAQSDSRWFPDAAVAVWARSDGFRHVDGRLMTTLTRQSGNVGYWPQRARETPVRYRVGASASRRNVKLVGPVDANDERYRMTGWYVGFELAVQLLQRDVAQVAPSVDTAGAR